MALSQSIAMDSFMKSFLALATCACVFHVSAALHDLESSNYEIDDTIPFQWRPLDNATHLSSYETSRRSDDDRMAILNMGFRFKYYNKEFDQISIGTNGLMVLQDQSGSCMQWDNTILPTNYKYNIIAPFWDDLYLDGGVILYETTGDEGNHEFIATWHNLKAVGASGDNGVYFQAVLQESTGDIIFNYHDVDLGSPEFDKGKSATVGLSDSSGCNGALYSFNEASLHAGQSIRFSYREGIFPPLILSPFSGANLDSDKVTVKWTYNGIIPKYTFLEIGSHPDSYELGKYRIEGASEYEIKNLPTNGHPLYIRLTVRSEDDHTYISSTSCNTIEKTDSFTVSGRLLFPYMDSIYPSKYTVDLVRNDPSGSTIYNRAITDNGYFFRFTGIPSGEYVITDRINTEANALGRNNQTKTIVVTDHDLHIEIPHPAAIRNLQPARFSFVQTRYVSFSWEELSGNYTYHWTLYDENGDEIANTTTNECNYSYPNHLDAGKTYFWDIIAMDTQGRISYQSKSIQFQIPSSNPLITSPMSGEFLDWGHNLYLRWLPGGTIVERWKLTLRNEENETPFWEGEFDGASTGADFSSLPKGHPMVYVDLSYLSSGVWHDIHAHYYLEIVDYRPQIISPLPGTELQKDHQTFVWEVSGVDTNYLLEDPFRFSIASTGSVVYDSSESMDWKVEQIGENRYSATVDVLPANGEDLIIGLESYTAFEARQYYIPYKAYNGGIPGQLDYTVTPSEYDWIDATLGTRLGFKGRNSSSIEYTDIPIPFPFTFYGQSYEYLRVIENGLTTLSSGWKTSPWHKRNIFEPGNPDAIIAPYLNSLVMRGSGGVFYRTVGTCPNRKFVVEWNRVYGGDYDLSATGGITFQMVLLESTDEIIFQYKDVFYKETHMDNNGAEAIVGIENQDGSRSCIYSYRSPTLRDETALKFTPF